MAGRPIAELFANVRPDMSGVAREVNREAKKLKPINLKVVLDSTSYNRAKAKLNQLAASVKIKIDFDSASATKAGKAAVKVIEQAGPAKIKIDIDRTSAKLAGKQAVNQIEKAGPAKIKVMANTQGLAGVGNLFGGAASSASGLLDGIRPLYAALAALSPILVSVAGSAAYASTTIVALGPAMIGAATAATGLITVFKGVIDTMKLKQQSEDSMITAAGSNAAAQVAHSKAIAAAQKQVTAAFEGVARAQKAAKIAFKGIAQAEEDLADAQKDSKRAQQGINDARKDALRDLKELRETVTDLALSEEDAQISLARAQEDLLKVTGDQNATALDRREAILDVMKAENRLKEVQTDLADSATKLQDSEKKGINGSEKVKDAQEKYAESLKTVKDQQDKVKDANDNYKESLGEVKKAQENVKEQEKELRDLRKQGVTGTNKASAATLKYREALKKHSKQGIVFMDTLDKMSGRIGKFRKAMETAILPGFTKFLNDIQAKPKGGASMFDVFEKGAVKIGDAISDTVGKIGELMKDPEFQDSLSGILDENAKAFRNFGDAIVILMKPLLRVFEAAAPLLTRFTQGLEDGATKFEKWVGKFTDKEIADFFDRAGDKLALWWGLIKEIGGAIGRVFKISAPSGDSFIERLTAFFKSIGDSKEDQEKFKKFFEFFENLDYQKITDTAIAVGKLAGAAKILSLIKGGPIVALLGAFAIKDPEGFTNAVNAVADKLMPFFEYIVKHEAVLYGLLIAMAGLSVLKGLKNIGISIPGLGGGKTQSVKIVAGGWGSTSPMNALWVRMVGAPGLPGGKGKGKGGRTTASGRGSRTTPTPSGGAPGGAGGAAGAAGKGKGFGGFLKSARGKIGGLLGKAGKGGIIAIALSMVAGPILDMIFGKETGKDAKGAAKAGIGGAVTGAGIGATIGSIIPGIGTLIGGAIGAVVGAVIGVISKMEWWDEIERWFSHTLPEFFNLGDGKGWDGLWDGIYEGFFNKFASPISGFFTNTIPEKFEELKTKADTKWDEIYEGFFNNFASPISGFFTNTIPEHWQKFQDWASETWNNVKTWFNENVSTPISDFFTVKIPEWWTGLQTWASTTWDKVKTWFNERISTPISDFFTVKIPEWWDSLKTKAGETWDSVKKFGQERLIDPIKKFFTESLPGWWEGAKKNAGDAWDGIKKFFDEKLVTPVGNFFTKSLPQTIIDGLFKGIEKVFDIIDSGIDLLNKIIPGDNAISKPGRPVKPVLKADGGYIDGTGTGRSDSVPARLSRGEGVLTAEATKRLGGRRAIDRLNSVGTSGLRFAKGGLVDFGKYLQGLGARVSEHSAFNGGKRVTSGHSNNSLHYSDQAIDVNYGPGGESSEEKSFFDRIIAAKTHEQYGLRALWRVKDHFNHAHFDTGGNKSLIGKIGDFIGDTVGSGINKLKGAISGPLGKLTNNGAVGYLGGLGKVALTKMKDWAVEKATSWWPFGQSESDNTSGTSDGNIGSRDVAQKAYNQAKSMGASNRLILALMEAGVVESGMRNLDYGDRDSLGFLQQRASWGSKASRLNVAESTARFIKKGAKVGDYSSAGALAQAIQVSAFPDRYNQERNRAYDWLKLVAPNFPTDIYDNGGLLDSGSMALNLSGHPERVLNPKQSAEYDALPALMKEMIRVMRSSSGGDVNFFGDFQSDVNVAGAFQMARLASRGAGG
jgi:hypothetical protein